MRKNPIKVVVILGPTSSGKSALAIKLAKEFNGEIISADSRQIFRHMDLGTGKVEGAWQPDPTRGEKVFVSEGIAHHLIDFVSPQEDYNVAQFKADCEKLIEEIAERGKLPVICGGSGFWISAVTDGIVLPEVPPNQKLRARLASKTAPELFAQLEKVDPRRAETIDRNNKLRLIRALEICQALGTVPTLSDLAKSEKEQPKKWDSNPPPGALREDSPALEKNEKSKLKKERQAPSGTDKFKFLQIGLDQAKEELNEKIKKRLESRWLNGMLQEVQRLHQEHHLSWEKIQSFGLAYHWIPLYLQEKISLEELKERVYLAEKNYAKRQRTWFKRNQNIHWIKKEEAAALLVSDFMLK